MLVSALSISRVISILGDFLYLNFVAYMLSSPSFTWQTTCATTVRSPLIVILGLLPLMMFMLMPLASTTRSKRSSLVTSRDVIDCAEADIEMRIVQIIVVTHSLPMFKPDADANAH